jgi:hypothetical protein
MAYELLPHRTDISAPHATLSRTPLQANARRVHLSIVGALALAAGSLGPLVHGARADTAPEVLGPNIVANGGFEQGADPGVRLFLPAGLSPLFSAWTVFGNVVLYGSAWQAEEGKRSLAVTSPSGVKQTLATTVGQKYRVVYYQAGNPNDHQPGALRAQIGGYTHDSTYQADASVTRDHMQWVKRSFTYTATAASTVLSFTAILTPGNDPLGLDNVQVRAIQAAATGGAPGGAPAGGTSTLTVSSPTVPPGGNETLTVGTTPGASLVIVVDYPDGTQTVTQAKADTAGHYSLVLTVPAKITGVVHVLMDSAGTVAKATFAVS